MDDRQGIQAYCKAVYREQLALLRELCLIPAFSGREEARARFLLQWLEKEGAQGAYIDGAQNVCWPLGDVSRGDARVFMAHIDTVFPPETPLDFRTDAEKAYCPGVGDDTANVTALLLIIRFLIQRGAAPGCPALFVFNTGEEGLGNLRGVRQIMRDYAGKIAQVISFDGQTTKLVNRAVGSERYRVTLRTPGGHSFGAFGNPNAIARASRVIDTLYQQAVPRVDNTKTTYNVGTIAGGNSVNSIAQEAAFTYEYRSDDEMCLARMRASFEAILAAYRAMDWEISCETIGLRPCMGKVDPERMERLLSACEKQVVAVTGKAPARSSSSTDANIPLSLGVPATAFGLYRGGQSHSVQEWIALDSLTPGLEIGLQCVLSELSLNP